MAFPVAAPCLYNATCATMTSLHLSTEETLTNPGDRAQQLSETVSYASDVGVLGILRGLSRLRGLILLPIIGRGLGAATYGVWTQSLVAVSIGVSIITLQLDVALVRFVSGSEDRDARRDIFLPVVVLVAALGLGVVFLSVLFSNELASVVLGDPAYTTVARWLGVWVALTAMARLGIQLQRGVHRVKLYGALSTAETLGQLVVVSILILTTGELLVAVWGAIAWELVFALAVLALAVRDVGLRLPNFGSLRTSLRFSIPLIPSYYAGTVLSFADRLVVAAQLGAEAVGIYAAAYSLARIVRELFVPVSTALLPTVSRAWDRRDRGRAQWLLSTTMRYSIALTIPALAGLSVLGPTVLSLLATQEVSQGSAALIMLMGIGYLFAGTQSIFAIALQILRDTRSLAISRGVAALIYIPLVVVGVALAGLFGAAIATLVGYALDLGLAMWFTLRQQKLSLPLAFSGKAIIASLVMAALVALIPHQGLLNLFVAVGVGIISFVILMVAMRAVGRPELRLLREVLRGGRSSVDQET